MKRPASRSQNLFLVALVGTAALALTPARWLRPWTSDLAAIVYLPVTPVSHAGGAVRAWLRPASARRETTGLQVEDLIDELDRYEQLYHASRLRIRELEEEVEQLRGLTIDELDVEVRGCTAAVVGRDAISPVGLVELNRGRRHGVNETAVAIDATNTLLGRVTQVEALRCFLMPIANAGSGTAIRAAVVRSGEEIDDAPQIQLEPLGNGRFRAEIAKSRGVEVGDVVRLTDPRWPPAARARTVGTVVACETKETSPLRDVLEIEPIHHPYELSRVTLVFEIDPMQAAGETP